MSRQSRFDAQYWTLGAGALGRPRGRDFTSPRSGIEPAAPALEGEVLTTTLPGKSHCIGLYKAYVTFHISGEYI